MTLTEILDPATNRDAVLDLVRHAWRAHQRSEAAICLALYRAFRDRLHRGLGISRFEDYAERQFGIKAKLAGLFKFIGSNLSGLPLTLAAMDAGELGYTKVREFVRLATPEDEAEWIEFAKTHTNRQIERKVRRRQREDGTEKTTFPAKVTPEERQALRLAGDRLSRLKGERVTADRLVGEMAKALANGLFGELGEGKGAGEGESEKEKRKRPPTKYVSFQPCPICLDTFVPTPEGLLRVPVEAWIQAVEEAAVVVDATPEFFCDCEGTKHRRDRCGNWNPREATAGKNRYTPAAWQRLIEARDGFVCRNPACRCENPLHGSHLKPHADGNPPTPENMRLHCATCNKLIAAGKLRVVGYAPYDRYYDAEGVFLGFGYDLELRSPDEDPARKHSHVGNSRQTPPKRRKAGRYRAASPPNGS